MASTVAAVIPTVGRPELARAVRSALAQTKPTRPIVVVADPDASRRVDALLGGLEVDVIRPPKRLNGSEARNLGVRFATSDLVAFLDDDDWWHPRKSEAQAREHDNDNVVSSTLSLFGPVRYTNGNATIRTTRPVPHAPYAAGLMSDYLLARPRLTYGYHFVQTSSLMAPRELLLSCPWNEALGKHQDWDLIIRLVDEVGARHVTVRDTLTFVQQASQGSVSAQPNWAASVEWANQQVVSARSRNDFLLSVVVRPSMVAGDVQGTRAGLAALTRPFAAHSAAIAGVALSSPQLAVGVTGRLIRRLQHGD